jgi:hypothetical protein
MASSDEERHIWAKARLWAWMMLMREHGEDHPKTQDALKAYREAARLIGIEV